MVEEAIERFNFSCYPAMLASLLLLRMCSVPLASHFVGRALCQGHTEQNSRVLSRLRLSDMINGHLSKQATRDF